MNRRNLIFIGLLVLCFLYRLGFGLSSVFWFPDELQIYLLGLKYYCTGAWPFFGPDVVYTQSQIPGALQSMLVAVPLFLTKLPEAPYLLLNILTFSSLTWLCYIISYNFKKIQQWFVYSWILVIAPWSLHISTHIYNPSYVLPASVLFFVSFLKITGILKVGKLSNKIGFIMMGIAVGWIMQIHLSWVLLLPFIGYTLFDIFREFGFKAIIRPSVLLFLGFIIPGGLLIPTLIDSEMTSGGTTANIVFQIKNIRNLFDIIIRYLSFASFESTRFIGGSTKERLAFLNEYLPLAPFIIFAALTGVLQVILLVVEFFRKKDHPGWNLFKWIFAGSYLILFLSFFFSIKGPTSHTFYILYPLVIIYSMYCYQSYVVNPRLKKFILIFFFSGFIFNTTVAWDNFRKKSLYTNRALVVKAIEEKDFHLLGKRRSEEWGCCY